MDRMNSPGIQRRQSGFALLDVALALAIFAVAVTALVSLMGKVVETSGAFAHDRLIQNAIEALLTETKRKPVAEMTSESYQADLGLTLRAEVESLDRANAEGKSLKDLYLLKVTAEYESAGGPQVETAELYIYQPVKK